MWEFEEKCFVCEKAIVRASDRYGVEGPLGARLYAHQHCIQGCDSLELAVRYRVAVSDIFGPGRHDHHADV